jgi:hypothetical protein
MTLPFGTFKQLIARRDNDTYHDAVCAGKS